MKFKKFLFEGVRENIIIEMSEMTDSEIHEFGEWIYSEFFDMDNDDEGSGDSEKITKEEIIELLGDMNSDDLEHIYDMVQNAEEESDVDAHTEDNENIEEGVSSEDLDEAVARRLASKNRNKKKRKFMGNSKADMRRTKVARKKEARKTRVKRKRDYRANKVKKLAYSASRNKAIKSGKHKVKLRRKA